MTVAFVAGATGYVGRAVVERLRAREVPTVAHVRPDSSRLDEWRERFGALGCKVDASPWDTAAMTAALQAHAATHVFVLIGTTRAQAKAEKIEGDRYEAVDYGLTKLLCDAAVAAGTKPRIVYLSSIGTGPNAGSGYFRARWKAEEAVRGSGLPWAIARPSIIAGEAKRDDGRPFEKAGAVVADGALAVLGLFSRKTRDKYRSIAPETLAAALVHAGLDGDPGKVYEGDDLRHS